MTHLIQRLEAVKNTSALPKWKSPYQLYLLALRDSMTPIPSHSRTPSVYSDDDDEVAIQTPDTASTAITEDSDSDALEFQAQTRKRKRSCASYTSDESLSDDTNWEKRQHCDDGSTGKDNEPYRDLVQFKALRVDSLEIHSDFTTETINDTPHAMMDQPCSSPVG